MIKLAKKQDCSGCYACASNCPKQCISMKNDNEGFWYPEIIEDKCINCGLCEKVCPIINNPNKGNNKIIAYACKNKDNNARNVSSSGGVFSLLCDYAISQNGIVFGAAFDEDFNVKHMYAETLKECEKFRGSKYVQSKIGDTYKEAKEFLDNGRIVLFSGTQCQIKGLNLYLRKSYDNLISQDVICHGVPSPKVFNMYKDILVEKYKSHIKDIQFRDKVNGWKEFSYVIKFKNDKIYSKSLREDIYMKGFLGDLYLRPSCYECKSKKFSSGSDISLADYWGIQNIHQEFDDDKGTSLVLVTTKKGQDIFEKISSSMDIIKTDLDYAIRYNPCILRPVKYNPRREQFFSEFDENNIEKTIHKYTKITFIRKAKRELWKMLNRIKK